MLNYLRKGGVYRFLCVPSVQDAPDGRGRAQAKSGPTFGDDQACSAIIVYRRERIQYAELLARMLSEYKDVSVQIVEDRDYQRAMKHNRAEKDNTTKQIFLGVTESSRRAWNAQCRYPHDTYGMKYGWNENNAFLRVVRLDDSKQKERFEAEYAKLAQPALSHPAVAGIRLVETIQAQYQQLLWDFVFRGYDEFAGSIVG